MLDSQARIVESPRRIGLTNGDAGDAERATSFPFHVGWSTLFVALESAKSAIPAIAIHESPAASPLTDARGYKPANCRVEDDVAPRVSEGTVQWEMVIPKMARPSSALPRPAPLAMRAGDAPAVADRETSPDPVLQLQAPRRRTFRLRPGAISLTGKLLIGGALAAGIAAPILLRVYRAPAHASVEAATRSGSWMRESSAPVGAGQARQLVLYRPSRDATDCRLEFTWKVSDRPLAWTFRAKDTDNYYAMAIKALRPGPAPALSVEHFTVYQGIESPHSSKVLILAEDNPALQVRMDVSGATFKLYLEGNAADYWTDNRLAAGGLGFLEQPDQPADVQSVRMSFSQAGGA
jgi:hypothetical protein